MAREERMRRIVRNGKSKLRRCLLLFKQKNVKIFIAINYLGIINN